MCKYCNLQLSVTCSHGNKKLYIGHNSEVRCVTEHRGSAGSAFDLHSANACFESQLDADWLFFFLQFSKNARIVPEICHGHCLSRFSQVILYRLQITRCFARSALYRQHCWKKLLVLWNYKARTEVPKRRTKYRPFWSSHCNRVATEKDSSRTD